MASVGATPAAPVELFVLFSVFSLFLIVLVFVFVFVVFVFVFEFVVFEFVLPLLLVIELTEVTLESEFDVLRS